MLQLLLTGNGHLVVYAGLAVLPGMYTPEYVVLGRSAAALLVALELDHCGAVTMLTTKPR